MNAELSVRKTILDHELIKKGDHVILGLSGGPDSLCLLHILNDFKSSMGFTLSAVHVNHMMRGEKAQEDVNWLSEHCRELRVPLSVAISNVYKMAEDEGISVEEAGRKARHTALFRERAALMSPCGGMRGRILVALAHNRDDQAETVLMRIMRGTGIHGLAAMEYERKDGLIRPLLDTPRSEIEKYINSKGLSARWDSTNASMDYTRNRLRLKLIPQLEDEYNPSIKECLVRLCNNAKEDDEYLEAEAAALCEGKTGSYPVKELAKMAPALSKRVVRNMFFKAGLTEDIGTAHLESLLSSVRARRGGKSFEFPHGYRAVITHESVDFLAPAHKDFLK